MHFAQNQSHYFSNAPRTVQYTVYTIQYRFLYVHTVLHTSTCTRTLVG